MKWIGKLIILAGLGAGLFMSQGAWAQCPEGSIELGACPVSIPKSAWGSAGEKMKADGCLPEELETFGGGPMDEICEIAETQSGLEALTSMEVLDFLNGRRRQIIDNIQANCACGWNSLSVTAATGDTTDGWSKFRQLIRDVKKCYLDKVAELYSADQSFSCKEDLERDPHSPTFSPRCLDPQMELQIFSQDKKGAWEFCCIQFTSKIEKLSDTQLKAKLCGNGMVEASEECDPPFLGFCGEDCRLVKNIKPVIPLKNQEYQIIDETLFETPGGIKGSRGFLKKLWIR